MEIFTLQIPYEEYCILERNSVAISSEPEQLFTIIVLISTPGNQRSVAPLRVEKNLFHLEATTVSVNGF